jgi:hypothetical protein
MDPKKLHAIEDWKVPGNVKELQSFLGLTNYYRNYIKNYSMITTDLTNLTKKDVKFEMGDREITAFNSLRSSFATEVVLVSPDSNKMFFVETDASDFAIGSVISQ